MAASQTVLFVPLGFCFIYSQSLEGLLAIFLDPIHECIPISPSQRLLKYLLNNVMKAYSLRRFFNQDSRMTHPLVFAIFSRHSAKADFKLMPFVRPFDVPWDDGV